MLASHEDICCSIGKRLWKKMKKNYKIMLTTEI